MFESLDDIISKGVWKCCGKEYPIYAHTDGNGAVEKYNEHTEKTWLIFDYFLSKHAEGSIHNIFEELKEEGLMKIDYEEFKKLLYDMVNFHDIGKINPKFQIKKLNNQDLKDIKIPQDIDSEHSYLGALMLTSILMKKYSLDENPTLLAFSYIIFGHHTRLMNPHEEKILSEPPSESFKGHIKTILFIFYNLNFKLQEEEKKDIQNAIQLLSGNDGSYNEFLNILKETKTSSLSFLYNLIYSYLITADFIATSYAYDNLLTVKSDLKYFDQRIDEGMLEKIINKFEIKQKEYIDKIGESVLNMYRFKMFEEAKENLKNALKENNRVFYLKMPTGGGKTNASFGLAIEILKTKKVDRLIYALPYVSILEQNYDYMKKVFNLDEPVEIRKIYSGTETIFDEDKETKEKILTDDDFYNYPVICTTNVSLFNSIIKFNKKQKYRFSSLANSIIILDEIQSLPSEYWPEFNFLIKEIAKWLNIYIIIMSATVPNLEKLKQVRDQDPLYIKEVCYLIKDPEKYYSVFKRNEIKTKNIQEFDISDELGKCTLKNYLKDICEKNFNQNNNHGLIVLNTIETSQIIFDIVLQLSKENEWGSEIMLLNSTLIPLQKRKIIEKINNLQKDSRIILISTQTIEAGVDVSFDFVVRDFAILDSIEQVRGRCNRHKEKDVLGNVYLIKVKRGKKFDCSKIYPLWRIQKTEEALKNNFQYNLSDIEKYYDLSIEHINKELSKDLKLTSADNISCWNSLKFEDNNSTRNKEKLVFHVDVIEEKHNSFSFFVEFDADMKHFSKKEIDYLEREQKDKNVTLINNGKVSGKGIIEYYLSELEKLKHADFSAKKIFKREIMSIMSKFVFSSVLLNVEKSALDIYFNENKVGPFYVINDNEIGDSEKKLYSLKHGLTKKLSEKLSCNIL
ncbi:MAG: hypothetical protein CVT89_00735 [Candidatus Altiarchaeales archaeon HGW-Altiarchaeales-2]|nr:MAG: hypothetical protein CVT89_00735 [Candidatus Altiarchaeales archaeon HGW-Altiarchaeales-2]